MQTLEQRVTELERKMNISRRTYTETAMALKNVWEEIASLRGNILSLIEGQLSIVESVTDTADAIDSLAALVEHLRNLQQGVAPSLPPFDYKNITYGSVPE